MAKNAINDIINIITTLAFVFIFIFPFLRKKKKESDQQQAYEPTTTAHEASQEWQLGDVLSTVFSSEPTPESYIETNKTHKERLETRPISQEPVMNHEEPVLAPQPVKTTPTPKKHLWLASKQDLRRAIIMKEILDTPKGLQ